MQVQKPSATLSIMESQITLAGEKTATTFYAISVQLPPGMAFPDNAAVSCTFRRNKHFIRLKNLLTAALTSATKDMAKDPQAKGRYASHVFFGGKDTPGSALFALKSIDDVSSESRKLQRGATFPAALGALNAAYSILAEETELRDRDGPLSQFITKMAEFVCTLDDFYYPILFVHRDYSAFKTVALGWGRFVSWADDNRNANDDQVFSSANRCTLYAKVHAPRNYATRKNGRGLYDADVTSARINELCFPLDTDRRQDSLDLATDLRNRKAGQPRNPTAQKK